MSQTFPPGITALAHKHRLGTPLECYTQLGIILLSSALLVIFVVSDILYILALLTHPSHFNPAQDVLWQALELGLVGYCIYYIWSQYSTYFYLCTEGFLELKRGNPPTVKHALRWDEVRSTRRSRRAYYFVTDKQGQEFRINSRAIWNRCNQQAKGKQAKRKQSRKRA